MGAIQPPFTLYTLRVEPGIRNSPPEPAVHIFEECEGHVTRTHTVTPEQALTLAADLIEAAQASFSYPRIIVDSDTHEHLTSPMPPAEAAQQRRRTA